jgi:PST family polysaccharide transporter
MRRIFSSRLFENAVALYGVQFFRKLIPLATVPYLTRTLGPAGWGEVSFALAFSGFLILLIEFGFDLSATRAIARQRDSKDACGSLLAGVLGVQLMLFGLGSAVAVVISWWLPLLRNDPRLVAAGLLFALAQGITPLWFFRGFESIRVLASLDMLGKLGAMCGVFLFVHSPDDGWKVIVLQAVPAVICTVAGLWLAYRMVPFRLPSIALMKDTLQTGWSMFVFRSGKSLYGYANIFILGLFASPAVVGYFAVAEKINTAVYGLMNPIEEALYPRLSKLVLDSRSEAARLARIGVVLMVTGGFLCGLLLYPP